MSWVVDGVDVDELGALYRPRYFHHDGIAVHGYRSVPPYPASHGCVRVTEAAMDWIWANDLHASGLDRLGPLTDRCEIAHTCVAAAPSGSTRP